MICQVVRETPVGAVFSRCHDVTGKVTFSLVGFPFLINSFLQPPPCTYNMASSNVVITGGNSRVTRQLIDTFLNHPDCPNLCALVGPQGVDALKETFPLLTSVPHSIVVANHMDEENLLPVLQNATIVVHNGPSVQQNEVVSRKTPNLIFLNIGALSKPPKKLASVSLFFAAFCIL